MNGFIVGAIVLFAISSLIVVGGTMATNRFRQNARETTPGAVGPGLKDWLLPAIGVDALAVVLLLMGLRR